MTVIVFDGKTLAADRACTHNGYARSVTKIFRVPGGMVGMAGSAIHAAMVLRWFKDGRKHVFPMPPDDSMDACDALFVDLDGNVHHYDRSEFPISPTQGFDAIGSGRDLALATIEMGGDARRAVEVASKYNIHCGNGIDMITLAEIRGETPAAFGCHVEVSQGMKPCGTHCGDETHCVSSRLQ